MQIGEANTFFKLDSVKRFQLETIYSVIKSRL